MTLKCPMKSEHDFMPPPPLRPHGHISHGIFQDLAVVVCYSQICLNLSDRLSDKKNWSIYRIQRPQPLIDIAAGIELIHLATLLHDDMIDRSPLRRCKPSALTTHGFAQTLLAGDFLLVRAFALCASLDQAVISATERACVRLTEGESIERSLLEVQPSIDEYLEVASKKTASLFSLAAFSGGHLAGVTESESKKLARFGELLGIAFQILDDVLDISADEATLGKKPGSDLRERKPSVVNLVWLESGSQLAEQLLKPIGDDNEDFVERGLEVLKLNTEVLPRCRELACDYAGQARRLLDEVSQSSPKSVSSELRAIYSLIDYTVSRLY